MKRLLWVLPAVLLLAACSASPGTTAAVPTLFRGGSGGSSDAIAAKPAVAGAPQSSEVGANGVPVPQAFDPTRSVILTASIAMKASDPWTTADQAQAVALELGGDVIGLNESGGKDDRLASLTVRVPSQRFTEALRRLRALDADVTASTVNGQDVSDQFVDLKARLSAKQAEEQRYSALLARAATIDEILKIDSALATVRTQIEQLQGQVNSIAQRTQFSTITVSIASATAAGAPSTPAWDPAKTAAAAFSTLAVILRGSADLAIWMLVFGWIPLVALAIAVVLTRGRRAVRTAA